MEEMEHLRAYNLRLLSNILPLHVAEFFLKNNLNTDMEVSASSGTLFQCRVKMILIVSAVVQSKQTSPEMLYNQCLSQF